MFLAVHRLERMLSLMKQNNIKILQIKRHKIQFLSLLLMADEQENMIEKYMEFLTLLNVQKLILNKL